MGKNIIFYGITSWLAKKFDKYVEIAGEPVVFSTKDEELSKYKGQKLLDKYDVLSLDDALSKYPDADIWVLYTKPTLTAKRLLKRVAPEKIHFFEADLEYRKGCNYLGHFISYRKDNFSPCCVTKQCPSQKTTGSIPERLAHWQRFTSELIENIRNDKPNPCSKCPHLKYGFYAKTTKLDTVSFGTNQPGDVCNYRCIYCFSKKQLETLKNDTEGFTTYEILRQLSEMPEYKDRTDLTIQLSNGEFCVNKYCNEIFDILFKTKWKVAFVTNMSMYNEKFAQFLQTGRAVSVLVSLDAGTRETYKKVKGLDYLERVVGNLKKYSFDKTKLTLKYIFLEGINDNEADVEGFYEIVKSCNCKHLGFSSDLFKPLTEKMRELALKVIYKAKDDGIVISANSNYLYSKDAEFIKKSYADALSGNLTETSDKIEIDIKEECCPHGFNDDSKITGGGQIKFDNDSKSDSNDRCEVILGKNSNFAINGDLVINPSAKVELLENAKLTIGSAHIQRDTHILCAENITIQDNVFISSNCYITDTDSYHLTDEEGKHINPNAPVIIKDNVWIGRGSTILKGVTIEKGAVIAPCSVVIEDVPENTMVQGNPAKIIKKNVFRKI